MAELSAIIENYRTKLFQLGLTYGLAAEETVQCSQQLDKLLNQWRKEQEEHRNESTSSL